MMITEQGKDSLSRGQIVALALQVGVRTLPALALLSSLTAWRVAYSTETVIPAVIVGTSKKHYSGP